MQLVMWMLWPDDDTSMGRWGWLLSNSWKWLWLASSPDPVTFSLLHTKWEDLGSHEKCHIMPLINAGCLNAENRLFSYYVPSSVVPCHTIPLQSETSKVHVCTLCTLNDCHNNIILRWWQTMLLLTTELHSFSFFCYKILLVKYTFTLKDS